MFDTLRPIRRLLYAVRLAIIIFILLTASQVRFSSAVIERVPIMIAAAMIAVLLFVSQAIARKWKWLQKPILALIGDIALVTVVVYFSDGIESPYYPLYYITVIIAAVDFGLSGALICASALTVISLYIDAISPGIRVGETFIVQDLIRTLPFLFLTALITGALRTRIRMLDEATSAMREERAATEREMEVAAQIQRAQLPFEIPIIKGIKTAIIYRPAREVGGDLYDFYPMKSDSMGLAIADVSGKGVPAALLVSSCKYTIRENYHENLGQMMDSVNEHILSLTTDETFITMLYGILCRKTMEFRYINAGHMPPIVVKAIDGEVVFTEYSDPPLGIMLTSSYVEQHIKLDAGDTLVLYTDGVTDAFKDDEGGMKAFGSFLSDMVGVDIESWGDKLLERVTEPSHLDDLTMVAVRME